MTGSITFFVLCKYMIQRFWLSISILLQSQLPLHTFTQSGSKRARCFLTDTEFRTPQGMVAAIKLAIGDKVLNFQSDTATNVDFSQEFHLARFSKVEGATRLSTWVSPAAAHRGRTAPHNGCATWHSVWNSQGNPLWGIYSAKQPNFSGRQMVEKKVAATHTPTRTHDDADGNC